MSRPAAEFAAIDHRLAMATECRRRTYAAAEQAAQREAEARHHSRMLTGHINFLLAERLKLV